MTLAVTRLKGQWLLAAALLLFGLLVGGLACTPSSPGHLPARAEARAGAVHQALERRGDRAEQHVEAVDALPLVAALLTVACVVFCVRRPRELAVVQPRSSALWLTPYLFRPPPAFLVR